jgi:hypothetical protein
MEKSYKGIIKDWRIERRGKSAVILGVVVKHIYKDMFPEDSPIQTSLVQTIFFKKDGKATVLTLNSKYTLI